MEYVASLLACDLFKGMDYLMIEQFLYYTNAKTQTIPRGTTLLLQDFADGHIVVVASGTLKLISEVYNADTDHIVEHLRAGDVFGLAISLLEHPMSGHVRATSATTCFLIPISYVMHGCSAIFPQYQQINQNLIHILAHRVQQHALRLYYFRYPTLKKRLSAYLCNHAPAEEGVPFTLPDNKSTLAEFLGVSRPTLVRTFSSMQRDGTLTFHLNSYTVLNRKALEGNLL